MWRGVAGGVRGGEGVAGGVRGGEGEAGGVRGVEGCSWWSERCGGV